MSLARRAVLPVLGLAGAARRWPVAAHQRAQLNAMVASTEAARRRVERYEVDHYLEELADARRRHQTRAQPRVQHL